MFVIKSHKEKIRLKKIRIRCWRRGTKELDLMLGNFADRNLEFFSKKELDYFEMILAIDDYTLYDWLLGTIEAPKKFKPIINKIISDYKIMVGQS